MYNLDKKKKVIIGIIIGIITIIIVIYVYTKENDFTEENLETYEKESNQNIMKNEENTEEAKKEIVIHISGAVQTEGVLFMKEGDRITNAIEKAGGTTQEADISEINLAYLLEDGMKIYIPKKGENEENIEGTENVGNKDNTKEYIQSGNGGGSGSGSQTLGDDKETTAETASKSNKIININTATQAELETLPGIGNSTAQKIISYRQEQGKFKQKEDIKNVKGIGEAKYNAIKDLIRI